MRIDFKSICQMYKIDLILETGRSLQAARFITILLFVWQLDSLVSPDLFLRPQAVLSLSIGGIEAGENPLIQSILRERLHLVNYKFLNAACSNYFLCCTDLVNKGEALKTLGVKSFQQRPLVTGHSDLVFRGKP